MIEHFYMICRQIINSNNLDQALDELQFGDSVAYAKLELAMQHRSLSVGNYDQRENSNVLRQTDRTRLRAGFKRS